MTNHPVLEHSLHGHDRLAFTPGASIDPALLGGAFSAGQRHASFARRAEILAQTRRLISERGCEHVRMRQLALRSDVTPPTIYALVGNRHDVLQAALKEGLDAKFAIAARRALIEDINPILAFVATKWDAISIDPNYYRQIVRGTLLSFLDGATVTAVHDSIGQRFERWLEQMQREGRLRSHRHVTLHAAALNLAHQMRLPVTNWVAGQFGIQRLQSEMLVAMALPLLGLASPEEEARMNIWLDAYC